MGKILGANALPGYNPYATGGAVRAIVQDVVDGKPIEQVNRKLLSRVSYENSRAANMSIANNAARDPAKPKYARVPTGVDTCPFCMMFASRGFVHKDKETASHAHADCDRRVVPRFRGTTRVEGYDPELCEDMWIHAEQYEGVKPSGNRSGMDTSNRVVGLNIKDAEVIEDGTFSIRDYLEGKYGNPTPMTFEQANSGNCNPHYGKSDGFTRNCYTCVAVYEMRRRGFNIEAKPSGDNWATRVLSHTPWAIWKGAAALSSESFTGSIGHDASGGYEFIKAIVGERERYSLTYYKRSEYRKENEIMGGHIVSVERDHQGTVVIYDPQNGIAYRGSEAVAFIGRTSGFELFRVDNAVLDVEMAKSVFTMGAKA